MTRQAVSLLMDGGRFKASGTRCATFPAHQAKPRKRKRDAMRWVGMFIGALLIALGVFCFTDPFKGGTYTVQDRVYSQEEAGTDSGMYGSTETTNTRKSSFPLAP